MTFTGVFSVGYGVHLATFRGVQSSTRYSESVVCSDHGLIG